MSALQIVLIGILGPVILLVSRRSLARPRSHGFWRFWAFALTLYLIVSAIPVWFANPGSLRQVVSFALLGLSLVYVIGAVWLLRRHGGRMKRSETSGTLRFEQTGRIVSQGLYRYIRHPMYGSLLLLAWGSWLKLPTVWGTAIGVLTTLALVVTARIDERECREVFGEEYTAYMQRTRLFVPFLF